MLCIKVANWAQKISTNCAKRKLFTSASMSWINDSDYIYDQTSSYPWHYLFLLEPIRLRCIDGRQVSGLLATGLIPDDQSAAQHECEHQRRPGTLEGITDHPMLVDAQQHQQQQQHIRHILDLVCGWECRMVSYALVRRAFSSTYDRVLVPWPGRTQSPRCQRCADTISRVS